jgi:hypothetical protein
MQFRSGLLFNSFLFYISHMNKLYVPDRPCFVAYTAHTAAGTVCGCNVVTVM